MYKAFYKLKDNPFRLTPDPAFLCLTGQHREALAGLVYSVANHAGLAALVGEAGTGKTTLLYSLVDLLAGRNFVTTLINNPTMSRGEFYDFLLAKLEIDCDSSLKSRQLIALENKLRMNLAAGTPTILIVDEAQRLPIELLEEIRLLLNMETPREKMLQIIVSGQPELSEVLARPELRQLKQRVSCLCNLRPLSSAELQEYVNYRLVLAGMPSQTLFPPENISLIHEFTQGIPRLVNSLCDSALQAGFGLQSHSITPAILREAAADLGLVADSKGHGSGPLAIGQTEKSGRTPPLTVSQPAGIFAAGGKVNGTAAIGNGTNGRSANGDHKNGNHQPPESGHARHDSGMSFLTSLLARRK